ncbi:RNase H domain containing protein [Aspergillus luchuensis]|uniref:RNase H domain containing protein n=1 Tax=Aspergillus kawachii TaxID=1069201 RepID=A0A146FIS8_ASPKA|nr:RNase H domain containing protein [Aspergillus luchuensis]
MEFSGCCDRRIQRALRCQEVISKLLFDSTDDYRLFAAIWSYYTEKPSSPSLIELYNDIRLEDQPIQNWKGQAGLLSG